MPNYGRARGQQGTGSPLPKDPYSLSLSLRPSTESAVSKVPGVYLRTNFRTCAGGAGIWRSFPKKWSAGGHRFCRPPWAQLATGFSPFTVLAPLLHPGVPLWAHPTQLSCPGRCHSEVPLAPPHPASNPGRKWRPSSDFCPEEVRSQQGPQLSLPLGCMGSSSAHPCDHSSYRYASAGCAQGETCPHV